MPEASALDLVGAPPHREGAPDLRSRLSDEHVDPAGDDDVEAVTRIASTKEDLSSFEGHRGEAALELEQALRSDNVTEGPVACRSAHGDPGGCSRGGLPISGDERGLHSVVAEAEGARELGQVVYRQAVAVEDTAQEVGADLGVARDERPPGGERDVEIMRARHLRRGCTAVPAGRWRPSTRRPPRQRRSRPARRLTGRQAVRDGARHGRAL